MIKYEGAKHIIAGSEYVVPGLALGSLQRMALDGTIKLAQRGSMEATEVEAQVKIIASAMSRNHPEITEAWVAENVDTRSVVGLLRTIFNASGLKAAAPGEAPSP